MRPVSQTAVILSFVLATASATVGGGCDGTTWNHPPPPEPTEVDPMQPAPIPSIPSRPLPLTEAEKVRKLSHLLETTPSYQFAALRTAVRDRVPHGLIRLNLPNYWGIYRIGADLVHGELAELTEETHVTVFDQGFQDNHPQLKSRIAADNLPETHEKLRSHGTHTVGTISGGGPFSVVPGKQVRFHIASYLTKEQALDPSVRKGDEDFQLTLMDQLDWAKEQQSSKILTASLAFGRTAAYAEAVKAFVEATETLVINASGNDADEGGDNGNMDKTQERFAADHVLFIGAVNPLGLRPEFSNHGVALGLVAPGVDVLSLDGTTEDHVLRRLNETRTTIATDDGTTSLISATGTSMAAPHVAGVAAMVDLFAPSMEGVPTTGREIWQVLVATSIDLGMRGRDRYFGHGMVNAYGAAMLAKARRSKSLPAAIEELKGLSEAAAIRAVDLALQGIEDRSDDALFAAITEARRAYFLDPNNIERKELLFHLFDAFWFDKDADALALELYSATNDEAWLLEVFLYGAERKRFLAETSSETPPSADPVAVFERSVAGRTSYSESKALVAKMVDSKETLRAVVEKARKLRRNGYRSMLSLKWLLELVDQQTSPDWVGAELSPLVAEILANPNHASATDLQLAALAVHLGAEATVADISPFLNAHPSAKRAAAEDIYQRLDTESYDQWARRRAESDIAFVLPRLLTALSISDVELLAGEVVRLLDLLDGEIAQGHAKTVAATWRALPERVRVGQFHTPAVARILAIAEAPEYWDLLFTANETISPWKYGLLLTGIPTEVPADFTASVMTELHALLEHPDVFQNTRSANRFSRWMQMAAALTRRGAVSERAFRNSVLGASHLLGMVSGDPAASTYGPSSAVASAVSIARLRTPETLRIVLRRLFESHGVVARVEEYRTLRGVAAVLLPNRAGEDGLIPAQEAHRAFDELLEAALAEDTTLATIAVRALTHYGEQNEELQSRLLDVVSQCGEKQFHHRTRSVAVHGGSLLPVALVLDAERALPTFWEASTRESLPAPLYVDYLRIAFDLAGENSKDAVQLKDALLASYEQLPNPQHRKVILERLLLGQAPLSQHDKERIRDQLVELLDTVDHAGVEELAKLVVTAVGAARAIEFLDALDTQGWDTKKIFYLRGFVAELRDKTE